jgi:hypothetical protein
MGTLATQGCTNASICQISFHVAISPIFPIPCRAIFRNIRIVRRIRDTRRSCFAPLTEDHVDFARRHLLLVIPIRSLVVRIRWLSLAQMNAANTVRNLH